MTWISVKNRLPSEDGDYLACYGPGAEGEPIYGINGFVRGQWDPFARDAVTHWMMLPPPPEEEDSK